MTTAPLPPEDVQALQAEIDGLKSQLARRRAEATRRRRNAMSWVIAVLAVLATTMALTTTWTYRTLANTDLFVDRVGPIIQEPAVVAEVADRVSEAIVTQLALQERIADVLPPDAAALAAPITAAARSYLERATTELIGTDQFQAAWDAALAVTHEVTITLLEGDAEGVVTNVEGEVTLDLVPVINTVLDAASDFLSELLNRDIDLPAVSPEDVEGAVAAIEQQFGVDLPADFGQVTLFSSDGLATAQDLYRAATVAAWLMPIAALVLVGLAVAVSLHRWRMLLSIVVGTALALGFVAVAVQPLKSSILGALEDEGLRVAVGEGITTTFSSLRTGVFVTLVLGVVAAAVLFFSGRSATAVAARGAAGKVPSLTGRYRGAFVVGGVAAALVVLALVPGRSWTQIVVVVLLLAGYLLAVLLAPGGGRSAEAATASTASP